MPSQLTSPSRTSSVSAQDSLAGSRWGPGTACGDGARFGSRSRAPGRGQGDSEAENQQAQGGNSLAGPPSGGSAEVLLASWKPCCLWQEGGNCTVKRRKRKAARPPRTPASHARPPRTPTSHGPDKFAGVVSNPNGWITDHPPHPPKIPKSRGIDQVAPVSFWPFSRFFTYTEELPLYTNCA